MRMQASWRWWGVGVPGDLRSRLLVAGLGVPLFVGAAYAGGWWLAGLLACLAAWSAHEFCRLALGRSGAGPLKALGTAGAGSLVLLAGLDPGLAAWGGGALVVLVVVFLASALLAVLGWARGEPSLASASAPPTGALYAGGTLSFAVFLREMPDGWAGGAAEAWEGALLALFPLCVVWVGDAVAYAVGRKAGRRRLAPRTSPGKTVEGGAAGLAGSTGVGLLAGFLLDGFPNLPLSPLAGATGGLLLGIAGQLGDLAESSFKRGAGVKDSGSLLGGHGGALDRFDGVYFAMPLAYGLALLARRLT